LSRPRDDGRAMAAGAPLHTADARRRARRALRRVAARRGRCAGRGTRRRCWHWLVNLLSPLPHAQTAQRKDALLTRPRLPIERIVSRGQANPSGFWYDQPEAEWVVVLAGAARLRFQDEAEARVLGPGDCLDIAPHRRHRVDWTDPSAATVWLAVFYPCDPP